MNSYTSSSDTHRRYVLWIISLVVLPAFILFILGIYLEPLYGDLTRIGYFSEREFGWTKPQLKFSKPLYRQGQYTRYHDVVVLGDSFATERPRDQWQNYLVANADLSVVTLNINTIELEQVIENIIFRETPPKILIFESVERVFPGRIKTKEACNSILRAQSIEALQPAPIRLANLDGLARNVEREKNWNDVKLEFVFKYFWNALWQSLAKVEQASVRKIDLARTAPFSSANKQALLAYIDDFKKPSIWHEDGLSEMSCRIEQIRKRVEANGKTKFVLVVAPDKLTAYSDFISDIAIQKISLLSKLSEQNPSVIPRIDLALTAAIRQGEEDVYLPDDTHWGSSGHRIVAETLLGFIQIQE